MYKAWRILSSHDTVPPQKCSSVNDQRYYEVVPLLANGTPAKSGQNANKEIHLDEWQILTTLLSAYLARNGWTWEIFYGVVFEKIFRTTEKANPGDTGKQRLAAARGIASMLESHIVDNQLLDFASGHTNCEGKAAKCALEAFIRVRNETRFRVSF